VCLFTVTGRQQDAIISSIHNMASFAPFPFYPRPLVGRYEADENDHHDYPMLLRIRSESSEMMKRKVQSSIFLPTRPHPVLERCQCSDCYHRHYDDDIYPIPMQTFSLKRESMDEIRSPPPLSPVRNDESDDDEELEVVDKEIHYNSSDNSTTYYPSERFSETYTTRPPPHEESSCSSQDKQRVEKYICNICDRDFTWFGNFQKHVLTHGNLSENDHFFPNDHISEERMIIRESSNNFRCRLCNKTFTRLSGLRTHIRMHNGQRPFKCQDCALAFTTNRALKMHSRIHSGERPYKCSQCDKTFTRKDELQAHTYLHKGIYNKFIRYFI